MKAIPVGLHVHVPHARDIDTPSHHQLCMHNFGFVQAAAVGHAAWRDQPRCSLTSRRRQPAPCRVLVERVRRPHVPLYTECGSSGSGSSQHGAPGSQPPLPTEPANSNGRASGCLARAHTTWRTGPQPHSPRPRARSRHGGGGRDPPISVSPPRVRLPEARRASHCRRPSCAVCGVLYRS
jgi:hypothetical protein